MRKLSYRHRLRLKRLGKWIGICALVLAVLMIFFLIYMQRYVVYTSEGVKLDFDHSTLDIPVNDETEDPEPHKKPGHVEIEIKDDEQTADGKLKQLKGVYITVDMLRSNPDLVLETVRALDNTNAVMIDVKDDNGNFYYNTEITGMKKANTDALDELIDFLKRNGYPMIARIPAFADTSFVKSHPDLALWNESGGSRELWADENENNWLSPEKPTVLSYQEQICKELSSLGFQEVVFNDFYFPTSGTIVYTSNLTRSELIADAAKEVQNAFTGSNLTISFCTADTAFPVDASAGRLYVPDVSGANVDKMIASLSNTVNNTTTQVVFLSDSRDTRFDNYGTPRPLLYESSVDIVLPDAEEER